MQSELRNPCSTKVLEPRAGTKWWFISPFGWRIRSSQDEDDAEVSWAIPNLPRRAISRRWRNYSNASTFLTASLPLFRFGGVNPRSVCSFFTFAPLIDAAWNNGVGAALNAKRIEGFRKKNNLDTWILIHWENDSTMDLWWMALTLLFRPQTPNSVQQISSKISLCHLKHVKNWPPQLCFVIRVGQLESRNVYLNISQSRPHQESWFRLIDWFAEKVP